MKNLKSLIAPLLLALICTIGIGTMNSAYALTEDSVSSWYELVNKYGSTANDVTTITIPTGTVVYANNSLVITSEGSYAIKGGGTIKKGLDENKTGSSYGTYMIKGNGSNQYNLSIENITLDGTADDGTSCGGIYIIGTVDIKSKAVLQNFNNNEAQSKGGAIRIGVGTDKLGSTLNIYTGSSIINNTAAAGGAIYIDGYSDGTTINKSALNISGGTISNNKSTYQGSSVYGGGAIQANYTTVNFSNGTISSNEATYGGGILLTGSDLTISGGTIRENCAEVGGGISTYSANNIITFTKGSITQNTATSKGGGIYLNSNAQMIVSGYPKVSVNNGGNVYLDNNQIIIKGKINSGYTIGITHSNAADGTIVAVPDGYTLTDAIAELFLEDTETYAVVRESGNLVLRQPETPLYWEDTEGNRMTELERSNWTVSNSTDGVGKKIIYTGEIVDGKIVGSVPNSIAGTPVTDLSTTFANTSLVNAPTLPDEVTNMTQTFYNCASLETAPVIPSQVVNMNNTFANCKVLNDSIVIPDAVVDLTRTFSGCSALETAPTLSATSNAEKMYYTFNSCTSLTGDVVIPDSVTNLSNTFTRTSQPINAVYTTNNTAVESASFPDNVTLKLVSELPSTPESSGSGNTGNSGNSGNTGLSPVVDGTVAGNMSIYGTVETIIMIDVTIPVTGLQFTINADRTIDWVDIEITSNSPSPLVVAVISAGEAVLTADETGIYNIDGAPALVADDTFSDWNNLSKVETKANIAISVNGENICTASSDTPVEICLIESAYGEDAAGNYQANPKTADVVGSALYGKGWDNTGDLMFKYDTILEFSIP